MRRVAITGLGIVSSIGNNTQEVSARVCARVNPALPPPPTMLKRVSPAQVYGRLPRCDRMR